MNINTLLSNVNLEYGFSWDCVREEAPRLGYAVSAFKNRERIFSCVPTKLEIMSFILENADVLFSHKNILGSDTKVVGGWQYEGKYYLDVSLIYVGRQTALETGILADQIAVWDIANGQEILCKEIQFETVLE